MIPNYTRENLQMLLVESSMFDLIGWLSQRNIGRTLYALTFFLLLGWPSTAFSQAFIEHLSPPVFQRGATTRVEVFGTETRASGKSPIRKT